MSYNERARGRGNNRPRDVDPSTLLGHIPGSLYVPQTPPRGRSYTRGGGNMPQNTRGRSAFYPVALPRVDHDTSTPSGRPIGFSPSPARGLVHGGFKFPMGETNVAIKQEDVGADRLGASEAAASTPSPNVGTPVSNKKAKQVATTQHEQANTTEQADLDKIVGTEAATSSTPGRAQAARDLRRPPGEQAQFNESIERPNSTISTTSSEPMVSSVTSIKSPRSWSEVTPYTKASYKTQDSTTHAQSCTPACGDTTEASPHSGSTTSGDLNGSRSVLTSAIDIPVAHATDNQAVCETQCELQSSEGTSNQSVQSLSAIFTQSPGGSQVPSVANTPPLGLGSTSDIAPTESRSGTTGEGISEEGNGVAHPVTHGRDVTTNVLRFNEVMARELRDFEEHRVRDSNKNDLSACSALLVGPVINVVTCSRKAGTGATGVTASWWLPQALASAKSHTLAESCSSSVGSSDIARIALSFVDPTNFTVFAAWLYWDKIIVPSQVWSGPSALSMRIFDLWIMGDLLRSRDFKNLIMKFLYQVMVEKSNIALLYPYNVTIVSPDWKADSKLCRFLVDYITVFVADKARIGGSAKDWDEVLLKHQDIRLSLLRKTRGDAYQVAMKRVEDYLETGEASGPISKQEAVRTSTKRDSDGNPIMKTN